jgi:hypothetical protein
LRYLDADLPLARFLSRLTLVAAQFGDSETTPGSMRVTSRSASLPLESRQSKPLAPPGKAKPPFAPDLM